jgi:hypothetical protein
MGLTGNAILMTCLPMKCTVELTEPVKTLQQLWLKHPRGDFQTRELGLLELGRARLVHEIVPELDVSDKPVYNWAHARTTMASVWFADRK